MFTRPGDPAPNVRARDINTIDEVPDSSWFTNRIYAQPLTTDQVARGPEHDRGTGARVRWTVVRPKSAGFAPGFTVARQQGRDVVRRLRSEGASARRDGGCRRRDPAVLGARLQPGRVLHQPHRSASSSASTRRPRSRHVPGARRRLQMADVEAVLRRAAPEPDGTYRVIAGARRARQGRWPLQVLRHAPRRSERPRAARASAIAARTEGVRRVDQPRRHESRQHARHA